MVHISLLRSVFLAVILAASVDANHIKRNHHHFTSRTQSQCRPRLHSSDISEPTHTTSTRTASTHLATSTHRFLTTSSHPQSSHPTSTYASSTPKSTHTTSVIVAHPTSDIVEISSTASSSTRSAPQTLETEVAAQPLSATYIPNSNKAGIAGGDAYKYMESHIGWWYDWSPNPSKAGLPIAVPMLWGDGSVDAQDASRLQAFERLSKNTNDKPRYVLGYEEPDCPSGSGSADMSVEDGVAKWEQLIAPLKARGTKLGSPSMCKQADETWLGQFAAKIKTPWDFTAVHINKNNIAGVKKDIEHYKKYGKPIWVTEFACVDDAGEFTPCTDQNEINKFINDIVDYFESTDDVYAYAYSNGLGLGDVWPLMDGDSLSESGKTYLSAISRYH